MRSICAWICVMAGAAILLGGQAWAADYPSRPITFVVPVAPGGGIDAAARMVADKLKDRIGQSVVVENRPGADSLIALNYVGRAKPDGYTLLVTNSWFVVGPLVLKAFDFDQINGLAPIISLNSQSGYFSTSTKTPFKTLDEFVAYARANPGKLNYASGQLAYALEAALIFDAMKIKVAVISYNGSARVTQALVGDEVHVGMIAYPSAKGHVAKGTLRILASDGPRRDPQTPDIPAITESYPGFPGASVTTGLSGSKGMPAEVVDKLNSTINEILKEPALIDRTKALAWNLEGGTPGRWREIQQNDLEKFKKAVKLINYQPQ